MKRKKLFLLPLLVIGMSLASCTPKEELATPEEAIAATQNLPTLVIRPDGSAAALGKTYTIKLGDKFYVLNKYVHAGREVEIDWSVDVPDKVTFKPVTQIAALPVENRVEVSFKVGIFEADDYLATIKGSISCEEATPVEVNFKADVGHSPATNTTIKNLKLGFKDGSYNQSLSNPIYSGTTLLSFYGYVVGNFEESANNLYSGVWIHDGEDGLQLFAGNLGTAWFANETEIGDLVHVVGYASSYNGLLEVKPSVFETVNSADHPEIAKPVETIFEDADNWNLEFLTHKDGNIATVKNLVYKSGTAAKIGTHWTIKFEGTKSDGTTKVEVNLYVNYHIGADAQTSIEALMSTWVAGTTRVDLKGPISWYNTPQMTLAFLDGMTPVDGITVLS